MKVLWKKKKMEEKSEEDYLIVLEDRKMEEARCVCERKTMIAKPIFDPLPFTSKLTSTYLFFMVKL